MSSPAGLEASTAAPRRCAPGVLARLLAVVGCCASLAAPSVACAAGPSVPVAEAVALAQEQLLIRGLQGSVYIESVSLRSASLLSAAKKQWTVLWSEPLPASQGRVEVGVEVDMKGNVVRLLKKARAGAKS